MAKALTIDELNDLVGQRFGSLVVLAYEGYYQKENTSRKRHYYRCKCDCSKEVIRERKHLKSGSIKSCGNCNNTMQGVSKHPAYNTYKGMRARVYHPHPYYHRGYIEKGITICEEWDGHPEVFYKWAEENGFKKGLSLDRIDNNKGYCPENCRWVDATIQSNNRGEYNHNLTFKGKTQSIAMWSKELGIKEGTLTSRLARGMSVEQALTTPVDERFRPKHLGK